MHDVVLALFHMLPVSQRRHGRPSTNNHRLGRPAVDGGQAAGHGVRRQRLPQQTNDEVNVCAMVAAQPGRLRVADVSQQTGQLSVSP